MESARALGIILGGEGLGGLAGAWIYGHFGARLPRHTLLVTASSLLTVPLLLLTTTPGLILATVFVMIGGFGSGMVNPMLGTFLQQWTPSHMLGRVSGLVRAGAQCAQPLGLLVGGTIIATLGIKGMFLVSGIIMLIVTVYIVISPPLRKIDELPTTPP